MRRLSALDAELLAVRFRNMIHLPQDAPFHVKDVLEQLKIITVFRPLSENSFGFSVKVGRDWRFMMINCNSTLGRQHFTIAHELYHLFYDDNPVPHICSAEGKSPEEQSADMFATSLLLPASGLLAMLPEDYPSTKKLDALTLVKMEQKFKVSHQALVFRLKRLGIITEADIQAYLQIPFRDMASRHGLDTSIYDKGNEGLIIGDYLSMAADLFESGRISEGHYNEIVNLINNAG